MDRTKQEIQPGISQNRDKRKKARIDYYETTKAKTKQMPRKERILKLTKEEGSNEGIANLILLKGTGLSCCARHQRRNGIISFHKCDS